MWLISGSKKNGNPGLPGIKSMTPTTTSQSTITWPEYVNWLPGEQPQHSKATFRFICNKKVKVYKEKS